MRREGELSSEEEISLHCTVLSVEDDEEGEEEAEVAERVEAGVGPAWKSHSGPEERGWWYAEGEDVSTSWLPT